MRLNSSQTVRGRPAANLNVLNEFSVASPNVHIPSSDIGQMANTRSPNTYRRYERPSHPKSLYELGTYTYEGDGENVCTMSMIPGRLHTAGQDVAISDRVYSLFSE